MVGTQGSEAPLARSASVSAAESTILDAARLLATFPGAICLIDADGCVIGENAAAEPLTLALGREAASRGEGPLLRLVRQASLFGRPQAGRASIAAEAGASAGPRIFNVTVLPCERAGRGPHPVLVLATESTHEWNLTEALVASRDFFRDLVACSADFAWETDATGAFVYVSPRGAIGYSASELNGRPAHSLIDTAHDVGVGRDSAQLPFLASEPVENVEVWLRGADGGAHCFLISALPVHDAGGRWRGARGVGRDVTGLRLHERELERAHARERASRAIVDAMLSEREPSTMLAAAARALSWATHANRAWILCREPSGTFEVGAAYAASVQDTAGDLPEPIAEALARASKRLEQSFEGWRYLGAPTRLQEAVTGAICIARPEGSPPFDQESRALVDLVARHTAVAINQAALVRSLSDLTRRDELTGLTNRRGFQEAYARWRARSHDAAAEAAVLYIDLDDFKRINDCAGHTRGDALLSSVGRILMGNARRSDVAARLGGDEFALFLEGAGESAAAAAAERLIRAARETGEGFGLSVGIAVTKRAAGETVEALLSRADAALYEAKRRGKGCFVLAAPLPALGASEDPGC